MKPILPVVALTAALAAISLHAQEAPPAAPAAPAAPPQDGFASEKERQSYALGSFLAAREKNGAEASGMDLPDPADVVAGLKEVLSAGKPPGYAVGAQLALQILRAGVEVDAEVLAQAVKSTLAGEPGKLDAAQQQAVMQRLQNELSERLKAKRAAEAAKIKAAAEAFLAENSKAEGVKTTPSGLQYKVEKEGDGKSPTAADLMTIHYKAQLVDGSVFDKSPEATPARKPFRMFPKGVQEGLGLLKAGGKAKFWVPPALGFGEAGRLPQVKPNEALIFEVELIAVEPLPKPQAAAPQPGRPPVTAVTPPITVEVPGKKPGEAPAPAVPPAPPAEKK